jgi:hypothetical protein
MKTNLVPACPVLAIAAHPAAAQRLTTADPNYQQLDQLADSIGWYRIGATKPLRHPEPLMQQQPGEENPLKCGCREQRSRMQRENALQTH